MSASLTQLSAHTPRLVILTACLLALVAACSEERQPPAAALITINNFTLSREQFSQLLKFEDEVNPAFQLSKDGRGQFLRQLIDQELLIEEARARKLDEQEVFRQTIQRYWESTLIRDLLNKQSEDIRRGTVVTKEEIAAWYQAHKSNVSSRPLAEQHDDIRRAIENEKVAAAMGQWIEGLRAKAKIAIADPELRREAMSHPKAAAAVDAPMNTPTPVEVK